MFVNVLYLDYSSAVQGWTFNSISWAYHRMINFFCQLKMLIAGFASKLKFKQLFCDEAMHFHIVCYPNSAVWAIVALFFPSAYTCHTKKIVALAAFFGCINNSMAD